MALVESARSYDAPWQSAKAQLDAATSRAEQVRLFAAQRGLVGGAVARQYQHQRARRGSQHASVESGMASDESLHHPLRGFK